MSKMPKTESGRLGRLIREANPKITGAQAQALARKALEKERTALFTPLPPERKPRARKARVPRAKKPPRARAPLKRDLVQLAKKVKKEKCPPISKMKKSELINYIQRK